MIEKTPIKLPNNKYQLSAREMIEKIHIPTTPDELAGMLVKDYEIEYEDD